MITLDQLLSIEVMVLRHEDAIDEAADRAAAIVTFKGACAFAAKARLLALAGGATVEDVEFVVEYAAEVA